MYSGTQMNVSSCEFLVCRKLCLGQKAVPGRRSDGGSRLFSCYGSKWRTTLGNVQCFSSQNGGTTSRPPDACYRNSVVSCTNVRVIKIMLSIYHLEMELTSPLQKLPGNRMDSQDESICLPDLLRVHLSSNALKITYGCLLSTAMVTKVLTLESLTGRQRLSVDTGGC